MANNSTNINKTNNHLSPQINEHKKDDNTWSWKTRSWHGGHMKLENQVLVWRTYEVGKPGPGMEDIWSWKTRSWYGGHMKLENQVLAWSTYEVGNPGPSLGQTQICGRVKSVNPYYYCVMNLLITCYKSNYDVISHT
jgi:hypothetical protein